MNRNILETLMGAVVLAVAAGFMVFAYEGSQKRMDGGYTIQAAFDNASGLNIGSDVRIGGIKIGVVSDLKLDPETYRAIAVLQLKRDAQVPKDSSAAIVSSSLLGDKYLDIVPGADDAMLKDGGALEFTQSSVNLEQMIGKYMFSGGGVDKKSPAPAPAPAPESSAAPLSAPMAEHPAVEHPVEH